MKALALPMIAMLAAFPLAAQAQAEGQAAQAAQACRIGGLRHELLCGSVTRALDPARPAGPTIDVHYAVVAATARNKSSDPVFVLAGGPGQSAIALAGNLLPLLQRLNNRRDVVFVDQRGTGRTAPLACASDATLPLADRLDSGRAIERMRACRSRLQALPHGDLRFYTTTLAMRDLDAVREALGAPQLNLVGASYGTRAALEYLRLFPQRVRRAVLDGVAPPDMVLPHSMAQDVEGALEALLGDCEREAACRRDQPELRALWQKLRASLPREFSVADPASGEPTKVWLTDEALAAAVRGPLYAPALASALPFAIGEAAAGRATPLFGLAASLSGGPRATRIAEGMHFSVVCAEDYPLMLHAPAEREPAVFSQAFARPYMELCRDWPRGAVEPAFYQVLPSRAPVLAFSGSLDPVTPPRHGAKVIEAFGAMARHVVVTGAGHGVMGIGCARDVVHRFIDAGSHAEALAVDASCLAMLPRPPSFRPARAAPPSPTGLVAGPSRQPEGLAAPARGGLVPGEAPGGRQ